MSDIIAINLRGMFLVAAWAKLKAVSKPYPTIIWMFLNLIPQLFGCWLGRFDYSYGEGLLVYLSKTVVVCFCYGNILSKHFG